jgi:glutaminase
MSDDFELLARALDELHDKYLPCVEGHVATYIPQLANADPAWFGLAVASVDGRVHTVGDAERRFTLQSISKPFVFGLALEDQGREQIARRVGVEPTGDAFNSIIRLDERSNRPHNPMVNAGAIAVTSSVRGASLTERLNRMLAMFARYVGDDVYVDSAVFTSERTTGHRNRAIAHLMVNFGLLDCNVDEALDLYFQQCSVVVTCRGLAVMAATLANGGVNPVTGARAIDAGFIPDLLTTMFTCGLYDYSGEWAYRVGLPGKSGIGGGILAVVPGRFGVSAFSPPLDSHGNSVRAVRAIEELSRRLGLHVFGVGDEVRVHRQPSTGHVGSG